MKIIIILSITGLAVKSKTSTYLVSGPNILSKEKLDLLSSPSTLVILKSNYISYYFDLNIFFVEFYTTLTTLS